MENEKRPSDECLSNVFGLSTNVVAIRKADIPDFLHRSEFYHSLEDSEEDVLVPQNCFKFNDQVTCGEDMHWLLLTLRFWIADPMIESVVEYAFTSPFEVVEPIIAEFYSDFPVLRKIGAIRFAQKSMELAIESGFFTIVNYLARTGHSWPEDAVHRIVQKGNLDMLKLALKRGCTLRGNECNTAAMNGHLHCLKYLREEHHCPWDENTTLNTVIAGSMECLQYAHENGCPWYASATDGGRNICNIAAVASNVACLKYAHRHGVPLLSTLVSVAVEHAIKTDCIQYAREQGLPWTRGLYRLAVIRDNLLLIKYLFDHGCPWNGSEDCTTAARFGRLNCLQLLHELGCPWNEDTCNKAVVRNDSAMVLYLLRQGCPVSNNLWTLGPCDTFAEIAECFVERGLTWDMTPCATVECVLTNNLKGLKLLLENGCPWHPHTYHHVINSSNLETFKIVHELGAPWPEGMCLYLARRGLIDWLRYAHTHGAVILPDTCARLLQTFIWSSMVLKCFRYAHRHGGCVLHRDYAVWAKTHGRLELLNYLTSQGCVV